MSKSWHELVQAVDSIQDDSEGVRNAKRIHQSNKIIMFKDESHLDEESTVHTGNSSFDNLDILSEIPLEKHIWTRPVPEIQGNLTDLLLKCREEMKSFFDDNPKYGTDHAWLEVASCMQEYGYTIPGCSTLEETGRKLKTKFIKLTKDTFGKVIPTLTSRGKKRKQNKYYKTLFRIFQGESESCSTEETPTEEVEVNTPRRRAYAESLPMREYWNQAVPGVGTVADLLIKIRSDLLKDPDNGLSFKNVYEVCTDKLSEAGFPLPSDAVQGTKHTVALKWGNLIKEHKTTAERKVAGLHCVSRNLRRFQAMTELLAEIETRPVRMVPERPRPVKKTLPEKTRKRAREESETEDEDANETWEQIVSTLASTSAPPKEKKLRDVEKLEKRRELNVSLKQMEEYWTQIVTGTTDTTVTDLLIQLRRDMNSNRDKPDTFADIARSLSEKGHPVPAECSEEEAVKVQFKWNSLVVLYRKLLQQKDTPGYDVPEQDRNFFDDMFEILGDMRPDFWYCPSSEKQALEKLGELSKIETDDGDESVTQSKDDESRARDIKQKSDAEVADADKDPDFDPQDEGEVDDSDKDPDFEPDNKEKLSSDEQRAEKKLNDEYWEQSVEKVGTVVDLLIKLRAAFNAFPTLPNPHLMFTDITQQLADAGYPVPAASSEDAVEKTRRKWEGLVRNQWHYKKSRPRRNPAVRRRMEVMSRVLNGLQDTEIAENGDSEAEDVTSDFPAEDAQFHDELADDAVEKRVPDQSSTPRRSKRARKSLDPERVDIEPDDNQYFETIDADNVVLRQALNQYWALPVAGVGNVMDLLIKLRGNVKHEPSIKACAKDIASQLAEAGYPIPARSGKEALEIVCNKWTDLVTQYKIQMKYKPKPYQRRRYDKMAKVLNSVLQSLGGESVERRKDAEDKAKVKRLHSYWTQEVSGVGTVGDLLIKLRSLVQTEPAETDDPLSMFDDIAMNLARAGYPIPVSSTREAAVLAYNKWINLLREYSKMLEIKAIWGTVHHKNRPRFQAMEKILAGRTLVNGIKLPQGTVAHTKKDSNSSREKSSKSPKESSDGNDLTCEEILIDESTLLLEEIAGDPSRADPLGIDCVEERTTMSSDSAEVTTMSVAKSREAPGDKPVRNLRPRGKLPLASQTQGKPRLSSKTRGLKPIQVPTMPPVMNSGGPRIELLISTLNAARKKVNLKIILPPGSTSIYRSALAGIVEKSLQVQNPIGQTPRRKSVERHMVIAQAKNGAPLITVVDDSSGPGITVEKKNKPGPLSSKLNPAKKSRNSPANNSLNKTNISFVPHPSSLLKSYLTVAKPSSTPSSHFTRSSKRLPPNVMFNSDDLSAYSPTNSVEEIPTSNDSPSGEIRQKNRQLSKPVKGNSQLSRRKGQPTLHRVKSSNPLKRFSRIQPSPQKSRSEGPSTITNLLLGIAEMVKQQTALHLESIRAQEKHFERLDTFLSHSERQREKTMEVLNRLVEDVSETDEEIELDEGVTERDDHSLVGRANESDRDIGLDEAVKDESVNMAVEESNIEEDREISVDLGVTEKSVDERKPKRDVRISGDEGETERVVDRRKGKRDGEVSVDVTSKEVKDEIIESSLVQKDSTEIDDEDVTMEESVEAIKQHLTENSTHKDTRLANIKDDEESADVKAEETSDKEDDGISGISTDEMDEDIMEEDIIEQSTEEDGFIEFPSNDIVEETIDED